MTDPTDFGALYAHSDDPWGYRDRWYERRKRDLTLAALPRPRFSAGFEAGGSIGVLSEQLAARCESLLVCDCEPRAVALARARLAPLHHVRIERRTLPHEWPDARFDLIVVSELGYFLGFEALDALFANMRASALAGVAILLCHWRAPIENCVLTGDAVHERFAAQSRRAGLYRIVHHAEQDFLLDVWSDDPTSVAAREGIS